jgi:hypothetical protein
LFCVRKRLFPHPGHQFHDGQCHNPGLARKSSVGKDLFPVPVARSGPRGRRLHAAPCERHLPSARP